MLSRAELQFKSRACLAQLKLRIVVFSIATAVPIWLLLWTLQKLQINLGTPLRASSIIILALYISGVLRLFRRTLREHNLICPHCQKSLGLELKNLTPSGACSHCGSQILQS